MNFSLKEKPKLNKDLILSNVTEEQIFAFYIGPEFRPNKLFRSKLRRDKNPTCSMYRNKSGSLIYKDFASGQHLNCFGYVMEMFNCTYKESLKIIANDFNIVKDTSLLKHKGKIITNDFKIEEKEFSKIQVELQDFSDAELKWWKKYGITKDILNKYNVYSCKHVFLNDQLIAKSQQHCPIFGYYGKKYQGNELWKIYFPKRKEYRWMTNYPSKKIQGYEQLPKVGKICVITKSMKDCLSMYSMGIPAIAPNSETTFIPEVILKDLKKRFKYIIVFYDNDLTGISNLQKIRRTYPELNYFFIPKKYGAKDFSDFYAKYGKKRTLEEVKYWILFLKKYGKINLEI